MQQVKIEDQTKKQKEAGGIRDLDRNRVIIHGEQVQASYFRRYIGRRCCIRSTLSSSFRISDNRQKVIETNLNRYSMQLKKKGAYLS